MTNPAVTSFGNYLAESYEVPDQEIEFNTFLKSYFEDSAKLLNRKDTATYDLVEIQSNQQFFGANAQTKRFAFRKVFSFGAIGTGAALPIAHGITGISMFTRIYGTIQTAADSRPLPYVDAAAVTNQVSVLVNGANIVITNGATSPAIVSGICVLEYLKN
jgi:hypothetical protein